MVNPLEGNGVTISTTGANVTVNSTLTDNEVIYQLSGTSTSGSFKIYSDYRVELLMAGVNLTNTVGPAINIQSKKHILVTLAAGSSNTLSDGSSYATSTEDQKATLFSEGQLIFEGTGTLNISSKAKHGICSDDYVSIENGTINITSSAKDAIHCNEKLLIHGGTITAAPTGDGFDCELGHITMTDGTVNCTLVTAGTKGFSADSTVSVKGGSTKFTTSGGVVSTSSLSGYDLTYCTAIKADLDVNISGGTITMTQTGAGSKGISADANINISGGTINSTNSGTGTTYKNTTGVTDAYNATTITADANINITGGTITTANSGTGGKGISANGTLVIGGETTGQPVMSVSTSGSSFIISGSDYCLPKTIKSDGALTIQNGALTISSANDGLKSETSITIKGGTVNITKSYEGIESKYIYLQGGNTDVVSTNDALNATMGTTSGGTESNDASLLSISGGVHYISGADAIDSNGNFSMTGGTVISNGPSSGAEEYSDINGTCNFNGGIFIGCGSAQMQKSPSTTSTQPCLYMKSTFSSSTLYSVVIGSTVVATFKPKNGGGACLVTSPQITKGSTYTIYSGGSYTGGTSTNGYYQGGTYSTSGATTKKTGTVSSTSTINSLTF